MKHPDYFAFARDLTRSYAGALTVEQAPEPVSLLPEFPAAIGPDEMIALYRNAKSREMKIWLTFAISDLVVFPSDAREARVVAEHLAAQELGRGLYPAEAQLLDEAVRDVLTARCIMADLATKEELDDIRARVHQPGFSFR